MDRHQKRLFAFLIGNMKDMEKELRAQSIVLDALVNKVITIDDLGDALTWARSSPEMLDLVSKKYLLLNAEASDWRAAGAAQSVPVH